MFQVRVWALPRHYDDLLTANQIAAPFMENLEALLNYNYPLRKLGQQSTNKPYSCSVSIYRRG